MSLTATLGSELTVAAVINESTLNVAVAIAAPLNVVVTMGGGSGITDVKTDTTIDGLGTTASPLSIAFEKEEITTDKVFSAADAGKYFWSIATVDITATFPAGLTKPIVIYQKGNGVVSYVDGDGVTHTGNVKTGGIGFGIHVAPETSTHYLIIGGKE